MKGGIRRWREKSEEGKRINWGGRREAKRRRIRTRWRKGRKGRGMEERRRQKKRRDEGRIG